MSKWKSYALVLSFLLSFLLALTGCSAQAVNQAADHLQTAVLNQTSSIGHSDNDYGKTQAKGNVTIDMLDIGQGDAILIRVGDEYSLIDTGDVVQRENIVAQLKQEGVRSLKRIIITHPHADHMGGFYAIAKAIPVERVYDNGIDANNGMFTTYLKWIDKKNIQRISVKRGDTIDFGNGASFAVLAPFEDDKSDATKLKDLNNYSIVGKFSFGKFSMLFAGDAEGPEENRLIKEENSKLFARVLKVGHHGSNHSTSKKWIRSIKPESALISVGVNNDYGHPGGETLKRLEAEDVAVYRTDKQGRIRIQTDGKTWNISTER